jgi:hypothetical protein
MKAINKQVLSGLWIIAGFTFLNMAAGACQKASPPESEPVIVYSDSAKKVLFVGNSLTYYNDLPELVEKIGRDSGVEIKTEMVAYGNYALEDHWNDGAIQTLIAGKKYDFVVVQQGPSSQADGRVMLLDYGARIKNICTPHNTKLAFYMVWPARSNFDTFDGVVKNYTDAAAATNSLLCPVGQFWRSHIQATGDYSYYGPDMFHPSQKGSEKAAWIIFKTLFK